MLTCQVMNIWLQVNREGSLAEVFHPWVRWERGLVEICEFVWRRRRLEIWDFAPLGLGSNNNVFKRLGS